MVRDTEMRTDDGDICAFPLPDLLQSAEKTNTGLLGLGSEHFTAQEMHLEVTENQDFRCFISFMGLNLLEENW